MLRGRYIALHHLNRASSNVFDVHLKGGGGGKVSLVNVAYCEPTFTNLRSSKTLPNTSAHGGHQAACLLQDCSHLWLNGIFRH